MPYPCMVSRASTFKIRRSSVPGNSSKDSFCFPIVYRWKYAAKGFSCQAPTSIEGWIPRSIAADASSTLLIFGVGSLFEFFLHTCPTQALRGGRALGLIAVRVRPPNGLSRIYQGSLESLYGATFNPPFRCLAR